MISSVLVVAVPCAVAGAASFGLASAIQFRATKEVPTSTTLNPQLLLDLIRKPIWLASVVTVVLGLSLQVVALAFGPLVLVQPLLVTSVVFGGMFTAWMARRRLDPIVLVGALACVGGLSAFLLLAQPTGQAADFNQRRIFPLALVLVLVILLALLIGNFSRGELRVIGLAVATGVFYGVTAGLIKVVAAQIRVGGITEPFGHWTIYMVCVIGPMGFLLSQNTFQSGRLISPALAVVAGFGLLLSSLSTRTAKVLGLALATGVFYGVTAGLMKVVAGQLRDGIAVPFQHWTLYAVCVIGPVGFLLSQNTFQQGMGVSSALAVITTVDPLVGVAIGVQWLGESVTATTEALVGEAISAAAIVAGIVILSHRGEYLRVLAERTEQETTWG
jgi:hypothetical protein